MKEGALTAPAHTLLQVVNSAQKRAQSRRMGNTVGTSATWCFLLSFLDADMPTFQSQTATTRAQHRAFYAVHDAMADVSTRRSTTLTPHAQLSTILQAFFIVNIVGITPIDALEALLSRALQRPVREDAQAIMIRISAERFTPEQHAGAIHWLITSRILRVRAPELLQEIAHHRARGDSRDDAMR